MANRPADLVRFLDEVREFAAGPYRQVVVKGQNLTPAEIDAIAARMAGYTGLSASPAI